MRDFVMSQYLQEQYLVFFVQENISVERCNLADLFYALHTKAEKVKKHNRTPVKKLHINLHC